MVIFQIYLQVVPLAAQCRKVCNIYQPLGTGAPQKSEKMRYLTKSHVLWALGEIFSGAMTPFWHSLLGEDIVYSRDKEPSVSDAQSRR